MASYLVFFMQHEVHRGRDLILRDKNPFINILTTQIKCKLKSNKSNKASHSNI